MLLIFAFAYSSHNFFSTKQAQGFSKSIDKKLHLNVLTELAQKQKLFQSTTPGLPINPLPCFSSFKILYNDSRENTFWKRKVLHYLNPLVDQQYFVMHFHFPSTPSSPHPCDLKKVACLSAKYPQKASITLFTCYFRLHLEQKLTEEKLVALKEGSILIDNNDWNSVDIISMTTTATIPCIYSYFSADMLKATKCSFM